MIYTLVGAPGTGKQEIAEKMRDFLNEGTCSDDCFGIVFDEANESTGGFLGDYRVELMVATLRACKKPNDDNVIFTHSLIDTAAYSALRMGGLAELDPMNDDVLRWTLVFDTTLLMLVDGYKSDSTLHIPYKGTDENSLDLDEALRATMLTLGIPYTEIDPDDEVSTWISS